MYQIKCNNHVLYDPRDDELVLLNPKCKLEVNTVGDASFTILKSHPNFGKLQMLKSIFEIRQNDEAIFRGRMTEDSRDFHNQFYVDLEGILAVTNDSQIPPFKFPNDFLKNPEYIEASTNGNVVEFFLRWILNQHNSRAAEWQRLKLGNVTVSDPNNYISRSSEKYLSAWDVLKSKLFDSTLGGYLTVRYEDDGNYVDYLKDFDSVNTQPITFMENLLDINGITSGTTTYSAILPMGATTEKDGKTSTLTLEELLDGDLTDDLVKEGAYIYSKSAREQYGWICAPPDETTWGDVTNVDNLKMKSIEYMLNGATLLTDTVTIKAVDLSFTDDQIQSFRIYRNIIVNAPAHGISEKVYPLTKLDIDILNPQNTTIVVGGTIRTMADISNQAAQTVDNIFENASVIFNAAINNAIGDVETAVLQSCEQLYTSKIEQFAKSITLEISGSLGNEASIKLSADGAESVQTLDLSKVRNAFADDDSSVTISAGVVTFNAGTIIINSENFTVTSTGVITATSGTIGAITLSATGIYSHNSKYSSSYAGWYRPTTINTTSACFFAGATDQYGVGAKFLVTYGGALTATDAVISGEVTTVNSPYKAQLSGGGLKLYHSDVLCGTFSTKYWSGAATAGISLRIEEGGNYIMFSHPNSDYATGFEVDYYLNYGWSNTYDEMHIFQTSARFLDNVHFSGRVYAEYIAITGHAGNKYKLNVNSSGAVTAEAI